jgi:hypothetical protein
VFFGAEGLRRAGGFQANNRRDSMQKVWTALVAFTVVCLIGLTAMAADEGRKRDGGKSIDPEKAFQKLDKDSDGKLTKEEFLARAGDDEERKSRAEKQFQKMDTDASGDLSLEEFKAGMKRGEGRKKKPE